MDVRKKFKLLKYKHIMFHFKACDLDINCFERYLDFAKILVKTDFAKFLQVSIKSRNLKVITYSKPPDYLLQSCI